MQEQIIIRPMTLEDIDGVLEIEHASFPTPWSREAFFNEVEKNHFATYLVVEHQDRLIGYCGLWVIIDEAHITNIAVLPEYRGNKIGELLLRQVMHLSRALGAKSITLEVRISNNRAKRLYEKLGFQEGGIRKNYYTDNNEDAMVMWVNLNE